MRSRSKEKESIGNHKNIFFSFSMNLNALGCLQQDLTVFDNVYLHVKNIYCDRSSSITIAHNFIKLYFLVPFECKLVLSMEHQKLAF